MLGYLMQMIDAMPAWALNAAVYVGLTIAVLGLLAEARALWHRRWSWPAFCGLLAGLMLASNAAWAADTKISALTDGDPCQAGDQIPIARGGANFRITCGTVRYLPETMQALTSVTASPSADQNDYSPTGWDGTQPSKATILRLTPTESIRITGLAGGNGNDGRQAMVCNALDGTGASGEVIILEHESASSTAANRFRFVDRQAVWVLPDNCVDLIYDDTTDRWRSLRALPYYGLFDGFTDGGGPVTGVATDGGIYTITGTGTAASCQSGSHLATSATQKPVGIIECDAGTTAGGRAGLGIHLSTANANMIVPEAGQAFMIARVAVNDLSDATEEYDVYVGFSDAIAGTSATDGVYWIYDRNASTAWQGAIEDAATQTATGAAGPTVDTNYIWLAIYITGDWEEADFFYSQSGTAWTRAGGQSGANMPDAADVVGFGAVVIGSAGTSGTLRNLQIDLLGHRYDMQRGT